MSINPDGADYDRDDGYGREEDRGPPRSNPTDAPGIFLMIVGILSLLGAGFSIFRGVQVVNTPANELERQSAQEMEMMKSIFPQLADQPIPSGEDTKRNAVGASFGIGGVGLIAALVIMFAGIRMRALQSYGLAVTGAVLAIIPCVTCAGCCGIGQGAGIWALVVLLKPEVKAMFR
jgi:hypothetical protein